jgi:hypothetical protein
MPQINQLPTRAPTAGDTIPFYSSNNGDAAKTSFTAVAALMSSLIGVSGGGYTTQYSQPVADNFSVIVGGSGASVWLILTPTSSGFSGTITLPDVATVADQQELIFVTTSAVQLDYVANGMTVYGAPAALGAGGSFILKYDLVSKFWYCIACDAKAEPLSTISSASGVLTINCASSNYFVTTLSENVTSIIISNAPSNDSATTIMVRIKQDSDTAKTVAWPASFKWAGGVAGSVSTTLDAVDVLAITTFDNGVTWDATLSKAFA